MIGLSKAPTSWRSWLGLMGWLSLTFAAAVFGGQFTPGPWYAQLAKPGITPPAWVFGPVWTALYAMMAVAAWLVWKQRGFAGASLALTLFIVQLALNALWSWIFFGLHNPGLAWPKSSCSGWPSCRPSWLSGATIKLPGSSCSPTSSGSPLPWSSTSLSGR